MRDKVDSRELIFGGRLFPEPREGGRKWRTDSEESEAKQGGERNSEDGGRNEEYGGKPRRSREEA